MNQKGSAKIFIIIFTILVACYIIFYITDKAHPVTVNTFVPPEQTRLPFDTEGEIDKNADYSCLPKDISLEKVVSTDRVGTKEGGFIVKKVSVKDILQKYHFSCHEGKLSNNFGKEARFYQLIGCWKNPPYNAEEILTNQRNMLSRLNQKYFVIELTCNPSGVATP